MSVNTFLKTDKQIYLHITPLLYVPIVPTRDEDIEPVRNALSA